MTKDAPLIVGISGASGAILGIRLLQVLQQAKQPVHAVVSAGAQQTIALETDYTLQQVHDMADVVHDNTNMAASISSGSFITKGMIVCPCSIGSLSSITHSSNENLLTRAADVTTKENRLLCLVVRESPLHAGHLELMQKMATRGALIIPPMMSFYTPTLSTQTMIDHIIARILDKFHINHSLSVRWQGI